MQQKDNDQFSFINEKIKEKPVNKKRLLMQAGFIALMAVVFGIIASLVFAYFQPKFESLFCPEEEPVVTLRVRMYRTCRTSCMRWEEKQTALS